MERRRERRYVLCRLFIWSGTKLWVVIALQYTDILKCSYMAKVDFRRIKPDERRAMLDKLAAIFLSLDTKKDMKFMLERLLTESEVVMLIRRMQIAEMLVGGLTYEQIRRKLKVGTATIRDVDGWLTDAAYEYQLIREHQRLEARANEESIKNKSRGRSGVDSLPPELQRVVRGDSRMILIRLLLGDL